MPALLDLNCRMSAADALHARRTPAEEVVRRGSHRVLSLKGSFGKLNADAWFRISDPDDSKKLPRFENANCDRGRIETFELRFAAMSGSQGTCAIGRVFGLSE